MPDIGKLNQLTVLRSSEFGLFLDGQELGDILLPRRYAPKEWGPGDTVEVFLMRDSEDRLIGTTLKPHAMVDEFASLRVVSCTDIGAFLDWGLPKDLLVPFREQKVSMQEGRFYVVRIYLDQVSGRIAATTKLDKFLDKVPGNFTAGQAVRMLIYGKTDLGYRAIINETHWGMIFYDQVFQPLNGGQRIDGFIQQIREDGKINLSLNKPGYEKVPEISEAILSYIEAQGGFMPITDKNSAQEINSLFGVSKKTYKKAIGALYKARKISIEDGGTRLLKSDD